MSSPVGPLLKEVINREVESKRDFIVGTVVSPKILVKFDPAGDASPVWVADFDIGSNRVLRDVPIRSDGSSRRYADLNMSCLLRRNTAGRYDAVGPADVLSAVTVTKEYDIGVLTPDSTGTAGFNFVLKPYSFYQGDQGQIPGSSKWNDGSTSYPAGVLEDGDGNPVT